MTKEASGIHAGPRRFEKARVKCPCKMRERPWDNVHTSCSSSSSSSSSNSNSSSASSSKLRCSECCVKGTIKLQHSRYSKHTAPCVHREQTHKVKRPRLPCSITASARRVPLLSMATSACWNLRELGTSVSHAVYDMTVSLLYSTLYIYIYTYIHTQIYIYI